MEIKIIIKTLTTLLLLLTFNSFAIELSQNDKLEQLQAVMSESKLLPTPTGVGGEGARFGESVSIDGNRALIGSPRAVEHGVAYIFDYDGTNWVETQIIFPDDIDDGSRFGISVSLQGDRALIGDKFNRVNGASQSGAAYVYDLNNGVWELTQKLIASDAGATDEFGGSISLDGDRALIGTVNYDNAINGNGSGAVYIFDYDGTSWQESAILTATGGSSGDGMGNAVSLDGDIALVGARNFDDNNNGIITGSAYLFERDSGTDTWSQSHQFLASDGADDDRYGFDVGISAGRILIGADQTDENFPTSGSAYVYQFNGTTWVETKLLAPDAAQADRFGTTVSIENSRLLIGAINGGETGISTGSAYIFDYNTAMNMWEFSQEIFTNDITTSNSFASSLALSANKVIVGNFNDRDNGTQSGAAYVFDLDGNWQQSQKLVTLGATNDNFGYAVSMDGNRALIGAPYDQEGGFDSGAAYIFDFVNEQWSQPVKLLGSVSGLNFGTAVSLSGNRALIGANRISAVSSGSAYIFDFDGNTWNETVILDSGSLISDRFGTSVSLSGDRALVGASFDTGMTTQSGAVYVFEELLSGWQQTDRLIANDGVRFDLFGTSVSLLGDRAIVGADQKDDDINGFSKAGAAYIYDYDAVNDLWIETKLQVPDPNSAGFFGSSVDLDNNRAIVGARNGFGVSNQTGSAYIFDYDTITDMWSSIKILASDASSIDQFGGSVSLDGNHALVGAYLHDDIDTNTNAGAAYQYEFDGNNWNEVKRYLPNDGTVRDLLYGWAVSLSNGTALIGAYQDNDRGTDSGSVYTINDVDVLFVDSFEN